MQLGSLRQLTLVSFFIALIPLIALLWQSQSDLARVAKMTAEDNTFFVTVVSSSRTIENSAIDIERLIRQFYIVKNATLAELIDETLTNYQGEAKNLCEILNSDIACERLAQRVESLQSFRDINDDLLLDAQLGEFRTIVDDLRLVVGSTINQRIAEQQKTMLSLKQNQAWSTAVLALLSLIMIIYGSHLIVKPFKKLKLVIRTIAKQQETLPPISKRGPIELVEIERDLHWLHDRLQQLEHLRTALLRHASHELKTPLASIKEGCSLLNEQLVGELSPAQQEVVGLLISSTERLNMLVEKLLDYNLLLQQAEPEYVEADCAFVVDQCIKDNTLALSHNDHTVDVNIELSVIDVDVDLFRRILDNLISNAIAHGSRARPISLKVYMQNHAFIVEVANFGKKIQKHEQANLFQPFIRGNELRNDHVIGAGLGLSIVNDCARLMHGTVEIVDVDYADVCFQVRIPKRSHSRL